MRGVVFTGSIVRDIGLLSCRGPARSSAPAAGGEPQIPTLASLPYRTASISDARTSDEGGSACPKDRRSLIEAAARLNVLDIDYSSDGATASPINTHSVLRLHTEQHRL